MAKDKVFKTQKPLRARNKFLREKKQRKSMEAQVRKDLAAKRTPQEQLARLDARGYVAARERAKLLNRIATKSPTMTDLMVSPESIGPFLDANPPKAKKGTKARRQAKKDKKAQ